MPIVNISDENRTAGTKEFSPEGELNARLETVENSVGQKKVDLTIMLRTQDYTQSIKRYEAVRLHYILIMVLSNLQYGVECQNLVEVYQEYIARLVSAYSSLP